MEAGEWELYEAAEPLWDGGGFPTVGIIEATMLDRELLRLRAGTPAVAYLAGPNGAELRLGLGGPYAFLQCFIEGSPHYEMFAIPSGVVARHQVAFLEEGVREPVWPRNLLAFSDARRLSLEFFEKRTLPQDVRWEKQSWGPE
jgi:hypothetical protein